MKTKKYLIAAAIIGGMMFLAQTATSTYNLDGQTIAKIQKKKRPMSPAG